MCERNKQSLSVERFKLACISDNVLTDEQVLVLAQKVVISSEDEVREFAAVLQRYRPSLVRRFFTDTPLTKEEILETWPQAVGELRYLHDYFMRTSAEITAHQLTIALRLAEKEYNRLVLKEGK